MGELPMFDRAEARIESGSLDERLAALYGAEAVGPNRERCLTLLRDFRKRFGPGPVRIVSAPGRTELGGNHTDHNQGKVLAASIQLDMLAAVAPREGSDVELYSEGYDHAFRVDLGALDRRADEQGKPEALIRGVAARLAQEGRRIGGFIGCITSTVLPGSGLSSSASFEVLVGSIINHLHNGGTIPIIALAIAGQFAENEYFGKPCGLMDQIACGSGGVAAIDFRNPSEPEIERIDANFGAAGLSLVVVNTGGSHADLTADYAAIPQEMRSVARALGGEVCRDISLGTLLDALPRLRRTVGDRALLRALHFLHENERVARQAEALRGKHIDRYLDEVRASGRSSIALLENVFPPKSTAEQGIALALALTEPFVAGTGAARVHGGGFAGTIQAYIPAPRLEEYASFMDGLFGASAVTALRIRNEGATALI